MQPEDAGVKDGTESELIETASDQGNGVTAVQTGTPESPNLATPKPAAPMPATPMPCFEIKLSTQRSWRYHEFGTRIRIASRFRTLLAEI